MNYARQMFIHQLADKLTEQYSTANVIHRQYQSVDVQGQVRHCAIGMLISDVYLSEMEQQVTAEQLIEKYPAVATVICEQLEVSSLSDQDVAMLTSIQIWHDTVFPVLAVSGQQVMSLAGCLAEKDLRTAITTSLTEILVCHSPQ